MPRRTWHRSQWSSGIDALTEFHDDQGKTFNTGSLGSPYATVLRTRLQVWAWWNSNTYPLPGPAQSGYPLKCKIQYGVAGSGSNPPPTSWPADPSDISGEAIQPVIYSALTLGAQIFQPSNFGTPDLPVWTGWANLDALNGDSKGQRRFDGTYILVAWLAISQAGDGWDTSFPEATIIPFYFRAMIQTLIETADA